MHLHDKNSRLLDFGGGCYDKKYQQDSNRRNISGNITDNKMDLLYILLLLASLCRAGVYSTGTTKLKPISAKVEPTYFWSDGRGNYKYAYDSGDGTAGAQSANAANEVNGHYTYYEKDGTPMTVKYTAGVHGFQAEVLPGLSQTRHVSHLKTNAASSPSNTMLPYGNVASATTAAAAALVGVPIVGEEAGAAVHVPLNFVHNVMKTMQTHPLQISFSTQQMHVQHQQQHKQQYQQQYHQQQHSAHAKTLGVSSKSSLISMPMSKLEVQQINTLSTADAAHGTHSQTQSQWPKRPYAFAYESPQSAHSATADAHGNVIGKYSYCDDAGYHDLTYKAGDNIGFKVLGGNLAKSEQTHYTQETLPIAAASTGAATHAPLLVVNVAQDPNINYSYKLEQLPEHGAGNALLDVGTARNGRSLRKFRRFVNW